MKKITRYLSILLLLFVTIIATDVFKVKANSEYIKWNESESYLTANDFDSAPLTLSTKIKLPSGYSERAGSLLSNYRDGSSKGYVTFEIYTNGNPSITLCDLNGIKIGGLYKNVNVATGDWVELTLVIDGNKHHCYVNGELKETKTFTAPYEENIPSTRFAIGGDRRTNNSQYFKGEIAEMFIYSDVRTPEEVKNDYLTTDIDHDNLMVGYSFNVSNNPDLIQDLSLNDNDIRKLYEIDNNITDPTDYDYSIAVVGDTQKVTIQETII